MRKETDPLRKSDVLDRVNIEAITKRLMELLDIRNQEKDHYPSAGDTFFAACWHKCSICFSDIKIPGCPCHYTPNMGSFMMILFSPSDLPAFQPEAIPGSRHIRCP